MKSLQFSVAMEDINERIDRYLSSKMPDKSRSFIQNLIREGKITVNDKLVKANHKVSADEEIIVLLPEAVLLDILPENIPLSILYEDDELLVIDKPKNMVVHPAPGHYSGTLVNALLYHCQDSLSGINGVLRPGIVHRIDKDTTGALLVCKTDRAHQSIAVQLKEHKINRKYHAIVHGLVKEERITIEAPIGRDIKDRKKMSVHSPYGRPAITHCLVLKYLQNFTYLECQLETGRTHQIRVHLASLGHPILGDQVYGPAKSPFRLEGQTLHARTIGFNHPLTHEYMEFTAPLPVYFDSLVKKL